MAFPRLTKIIINHFLKQHKSLSNLKYQHYHTIKDDGIVSPLKFVRIGEDNQEYRLAIPEVMLNDAIKQSESYQMFIKYSTGQIPLKKSRDKGSQRKKTVDDSQETVDVSEESEPEPKPVKRKTASKSISKTEAEEAEAARQVHATHARIVTESIPKPTRRRKSGKVTSDPPKKLKGVPSLTPEEQEAADTMQALKESRKTSKTQPGTGRSSEELSTYTGFLMTVRNRETKLGGRRARMIKMIDANDEGDTYISDNQDADDEDAETESDEDEIYKYKIRDEEITDAAKEDAKKTSEVKDDAKKTELPPTSSSLSVSSGFGDRFLQLSFDSSLVSNVKDTTDSMIKSLLEVKIQSEVPHNQSLSMLSVPVFVLL
ncbi:hypothetical protein Tco_0655614 [Tanacetum coccineum]|uniref:Uncharacterized protein n=1 Tax=Tanacetum coccineum TaxID=301880 RepID=A0ABQ4X746_9ASTR